jgi:cyclopropane fatty-acyl-phospholipid synthase-like methyltransferase
MTTVVERHDTVWQDPKLARTFLHAVRGGIPFEEAQLEIMLRVLDARGEPVRRLLDLGCGGGALARTVLARYPDATATLLDFSEPMLAVARTHLAQRTPPVRFVSADLADPDWRRRLGADSAFDAVVSGYAIHHLADSRKRALYGEIFSLLDPGGCFINVEHVASRSAWVESVSDDLMVDSLTRFHRAAGNEKTRAQVAAEFVHRPDKAANILAPVEVQCDWLRRRGYVDVDCFFKAFELAVFGGRKPGGRSMGRASAVEDQSPAVGRTKSPHAVP